MPVSERNRIALDSLVQSIRTRSVCLLTNSTLKNIKQKQKLDIKLSHFLNDFYVNRLDEASINQRLKKSLGQGPWRFDQIKNDDSLIRYQGRIRSFGNLEAFIGYVVSNKRIIGRRIYFQIRSKSDCIQENDQGCPDLLYLVSFAPKYFDFKLELSEWYPFFHSDIWIDPNITSSFSKKVEALLSKSTAQ